MGVRIDQSGQHGRAGEIDHLSVRRNLHLRGAADFADALARVNETLDPRERIQRYAILPDRWLPGDELTDTLKLRRQRIASKYAEQITSLYE